MTLQRNGGGEPVNQKHWVKDLCSFFTRGWLEWDRRSLSLVSGDARGSCLQMSTPLRVGWYMLEMQIDTAKMRQKGTIVITDRQGKAFRYAMHLSAGKISKRLINIDTLGTLTIEPGLPAECIRVLHFRLIRVAKSFAASRMTTKLNALHPQYRADRALRKRQRLHTRAVATPLPQLWADYCNLHDETADIAPYYVWVERFDTPSFNDLLAVQSDVEKLGVNPVVTVLMPVFNPNLTWLAEAIDSVRNQIYPHWQLCIADDASADPRVGEMLRSYAAQDSRIVVHVRAQNGHISACSNSALALAIGEWIALLDHDDRLSPDALLCVVAMIDRQTEVRLLYSDEDKIDEEGHRSDPYFKCDWNRDLFYSQNMISHLGVYHAALVREVGGFRLGYEGSQDYDLALRCIEQIEPTQIHHIPRILYHWRIHAESTANGPDAKPYAVAAGERALNDHFERIGVPAKVDAVKAGYRARYAIAEYPLVTLIIPTHNAVALLHQCVSSILERTTYPHYEILVVDNRSDDPKTLAYLHEIAKRDNIRVERNLNPFNYSAINNKAVQLAKGTVIGLLNNDVEVINGDWLDEMVSHAMRPGIGAVGAKLLYSDDTIQHAGIILGIHGIAGHAHRYAERESVGYCGRAALIQSYSAVTAACLVVRRALFEKVGGFNEEALAIACNDVDFCLRLRQAGYRTLWTPYAELYHHESSTRGFDDTPEKLARAATENAYMRQRWAHVLDADPAYSPNLTLDGEDFSPAWPPRSGKDLTPAMAGYLAPTALAVACL